MRYVEYMYPRLRARTALSGLTVALRPNGTAAWLPTTAQTGGDGCSGRALALVETSTAIENIDPDKQLLTYTSAGTAECNELSEVCHFPSSHFRNVVFCLTN